MLATPPCALAQFAISAEADAISPETGHHPLAFRLRNRGSRCILFGYPDVALLSGVGKRLPFRIVHRGRPVRIVVRRRQSAYFVLDKYRCDLGDRALARKVRIATRIVAVPRAAGIAYCGKGDPGSVVTVTPFVSAIIP